MFGISYSTWKDTCDMYFRLSSTSLKTSLQWFPFSKLSKQDKNNISSEAFFYEYIQSGSFVLFPQIMNQSENYLQKADGSFRESSLVSPVLYLILQVIGKEIHDNYKNEENLNYTTTYYAGNYINRSPKYKQDYDDYFKEINICSSEYSHFIRTDISNFFSFINLDILIAQIDKICNMKNVVFTQTQLQLFKSLFSYIGNGKFPLLENSIGSSFLSTIVYLHEIDYRLENYLNTHIFKSASFRMVRYVDDLYIFFNHEEENAELVERYNDIRNEYSSILKEYNLALNTKKSCVKSTAEINDELKKSLYDEYFNGVKCNIEEMFPDAMNNFLKDLYLELVLDSIDIEKYNDLIIKHFSSDNIEFTPSEIFNYYVYENNEIFTSNKTIDLIEQMVNISISFINLDPKRLTVMLMKTKNNKVIKGFLNQLFTKNRKNIWNSYDTNIAISYLLQSEFRHIDLLNIFYNKNPQLYKYYYDNCRCSFYSIFDFSNINELNSIIKDDIKAKYLYFMYICENMKNNHMASFAYYKNYFDRVTADIDYCYNDSFKLKKPNYKAFYREDSIKKFYKEIIGSDNIIQKAHLLRNSNPLSHSSSDLIENNNTTDELIESIDNLSKLLVDYITLKNN